jgi:hypothetical protein
MEICKYVLLFDNIYINPGILKLVDSNKLSLLWQLTYWNIIIIIIIIIIITYNRPSHALCL